MSSSRRDDKYWAADGLLKGVFISIHIGQRITDLEFERFFFGFKMKILTVSQYLFIYFSDKIIAVFCMSVNQSILT